MAELSDVIQLIRGFNVFRYFNIVSSGTYLVKSGPGLFKSVVINLPELNSVITIFDGSAAIGATIATITKQVADTFEFSVAFNTSLTVVVSKNQNITIIYQ